MEVTAIFDEEGNQLFPTASVFKSTTAPSNRFAVHTVEDGSTVADNKVEEQLRISITLALSPSDYIEVYKQIVAADKETLKLTIQTKVATYENMYIERYPSEESAKVFDTLIIPIDFIEQRPVKVVIEQLAVSDVEDPADSDTTNRGEQLPKDNSKTTLQKLAEWFN